MSELTAEITKTITVDPDASETDTEPQTTYSVARAGDARL